MTELKPPSDKSKRDFAIAFGLAQLDEETMRGLLFFIATYDTDADMEKVIQFAYDVRTSINDKIQERLREMKS
jgi:hypothetical protein